MISEIKSIYYEKNSEINYYYFYDNKQDIDESIDMSTGWSFVCLDEMINYYTDNLNKSK
uniref:Uncharacterized protein n=1 Tax=Polysiphonia sertularioides TaxID=945028 RepID=A0A1Z1M9P4_9FLOR|nr:hypothetical protein [Polysiphonia sertularioides]ARW62464.1 hypothetical protein [Polysiphonia sertularioides]